MIRVLYDLLYCELKKIQRSVVFPATVVAMNLAPLFGALFIIILRDPETARSNPGLLTKAEMTGFAPDWESYFNLIGQAIGVGGLIVFGFIMSWIYGREYVEHTTKDLFMLPVERVWIVMTKFIAGTLWVFIILITLYLSVLLAGTILQLDGWSQLSPEKVIRLTLPVTAMSLMISFPVAAIASLGRGYMAPIAFVILMVVAAQIFGALGYGAYFPWAIPGLYANISKNGSLQLDIISYLIVALAGAVGVIATVWVWYRQEPGK